MVGSQRFVQTPAALSATVLLASAHSGSRADCEHCGRPVERGAAAFCSDGCESMHRLIIGAGLERYYELRGDDRPPAATPAAARTHTWLEPLARHIASAEVLRQLAFDVRGLHSGGCVWLIEELFRRQTGRLQIAVHRAMSRIELWVARDFRLDRFVSELERFGYTLAPVRARAAERTAGLRARIAQSAALAVASIVVPVVLGPRHAIAIAGVLVLGGLALWTSAPAFFRSALRGLRRGAIVAELPISVGLLCAWAGSAWSAATDAIPVAGCGVAMLVALSVGGRALLDWMLERERRHALAGDGADGIVCRRVKNEKVDLVGCRRIHRGDDLLIAPGELVPVEAILSPGSEPAEFVFDAQDGGGPRPVAAGERVPAGAYNAGSSAVRVCAAQPFSLAALFPARPEASASASHSGLALLLAAGAGAALWSLAGHGPRALDAAAAILLAWPPASFAIAIARQRVEARLRRDGLLVRRADFLERARAVRRVALDKAGTLTASSLELRFPEVLARLDAEECAALYHLASHSPHPRCAAVRRALAREGQHSLLEGVAVRAEPCQGVEAEIEGRRYRLGAPRWVVERGAAPAAGLGFSRDGRLLAWFIADESPRPSARDGLAALSGLELETWLLSSDRPELVAEMAEALGVPAGRARGDMKPRDKVAWLAEHDRGDTLFIGDGITDGAAGAAASVSGTPAADRPLMAAASDFYLTSAGLSPVASALAAARELHLLVRLSQLAGGACSSAAVFLALVGMASPVLVAASMPVAALAIAAVATRSFARERAPGPGRSGRLELVAAPPAAT
jgi:Cu2+-exporting ATPase